MLKYMSGCLHKKNNGNLNGNDTAHLDQTHNVYVLLVHVCDGKITIGYHSMMTNNNHWSTICVYNYISIETHSCTILSHYHFKHNWVTIHYHSHTIHSHQYTIDLQLGLQLYHAINTMIHHSILYYHYKNHSKPLSYHSLLCNYH